ncbi:MAG TPA: class I SAM-dependent RNA methyltransferase [Bryobacteraceae bacterium]|nr:class I SAM-dependent RNA methyltransferase [Bryobacteraceae bacterium]
MYGGEGLARVAENGKPSRVVLAPYVLPGERVRVEPEQEKPGLVRARTLEVVEAAPDRVPPPCPYFGRCGGCHYQHASYAAQLAAKRAILEEELRRLGKIEPPTEIATISAEPWAYRNRVQLHCEGQSLGYREARSHKLCAITHCPISSPKINQTIGALLSMMRDRRWPRFVRSLEIFTDEQQVQLNVLDSAQPVARRFFDWCAERIPGLVEGDLYYQSRFHVSRNSFFQVNRFLLQELVEAAVSGAQGESAVDLYSGVGLFAVALARTFRRVVAVESSSAAVRDLERNAPGIQAIHATAESYLESLAASFDFVLLDPPRAGIGKTVVRRLLDLRPRALTIVSCDPATLARDLSALAGGGYRIDRMTLIDLFPQTYHFETVVHLI